MVVSGITLRRRCLRIRYMLSEGTVSSMSVYELIVNQTAFGIAESVVRWPSGLGERQIL